METSFKDNFEKITAILKETVGEDSAQTYLDLIINTSFNLGIKYAMGMREHALQHSDSFESVEEACSDFEAQFFVKQKSDFDLLPTNTFKIEAL